MAIKFTDGLQGNNTVSFEMIVCADCKVPFMLQAIHIVKLRSTGDTFYCPNGHRMVYGTSCDKEKKRLKEELETAKQKLHEAWETCGKRTRELWEMKDANTELRKKDCPHCKKRFINIERHIKKNHS